MSLKAITIEILKADGVINADAAYRKIAAAGGFGSFDASFRPALDLSGLSEETNKQIEKIIADAKKEK